MQYQGRFYALDFLPNGLIRIDERGGTGFSACFEKDSYKKRHGELRLSPYQVGELVRLDQEESKRLTSY